ncbi:unnamed protein product [Caretta caretta]
MAPEEQGCAWEAPRVWQQRAPGRSSGLEGACGLMPCQPHRLENHWVSPHLAPTNDLTLLHLGHSQAGLGLWGPLEGPSDSNMSVSSNGSLQAPLQLLPKCWSWPLGCPGMTGCVCPQLCTAEPPLPLPGFVSLPVDLRSG